MSRRERERETERSGNGEIPRKSGAFYPPTTIPLAGTEGNSQLINIGSVQNRLPSAHHSTRKRPKVLSSRESVWRQNICKWSPSRQRSTNGAISVYHHRLFFALLFLLHKMSILIWPQRQPTIIPPPPSPNWIVPVSWLIFDLIAISICNAFHMSITNCLGVINIIQTL